MAERAAFDDTTEGGFSSVSELYDRPLIKRDALCQEWAMVVLGVARSPRKRAGDGARLPARRGTVMLSDLSPASIRELEALGLKDLFVQADRAAATMRA